MSMLLFKQIDSNLIGVKKIDSSIFSSKEINQVLIINKISSKKRALEILSTKSLLNLMERLKFLKISISLFHTLQS